MDKKKSLAHEPGGNEYVKKKPSGAFLTVYELLEQKEEQAMRSFIRSFLLANKK